MLDLERHCNCNYGGKEQDGQNLLLGQLLPVEENEGKENDKIDNDTGVEKDVQRSLDESEFPSFCSDGKHEPRERVDELYAQKQRSRCKDQKECFVPEEAEAHGKDDIDAHQQGHNRLQAVEKSVDKIVHPDGYSRYMLQRKTSRDIQREIQERTQQYYRKQLVRDGGEPLGRGIMHHETQKEYQRAEFELELVCIID